MAAPDGTIYLLHFSRPYKHAKHYIGWTTNLDARLTEHRAGNGARLLAVIREVGIEWELARTWSGTRSRERQLKQRGASRRCPLCKENLERTERAGCQDNSRLPRSLQPTACAALLY